MTFPISPSRDDRVTYVQFGGVSAEDCERIAQLAATITPASGLVSAGQESTGRQCDIRWIEWNDNTVWLFLLVEAWFRGANQMYDFDLRGVEALQHTTYHVGHQYDFHMDSGSASEYPRKLSISAILNDGYEGGYFEFFTGGGAATRVMLPKGQVLVFPSWLVHRVTPVLNGTRLSLVAWAHGPRFR